MVDTGKTAASKSGIQVDTALVRELAELLAETGAERNRGRGR